MRYITKLIKCRCEELSNDIKEIRLEWVAEKITNEQAVDRLWEVRTNAAQLFQLPLTYTARNRVKELVARCDGMINHITNYPNKYR